MDRSLLSLCLVAALAPGVAHAGNGRVVWVGVDYGLVHMVGTGDFREPDEIFPGYLDKWNGLVLSEQLDDLGKRLKAEVVAEVSHLSELHAAADPGTQIVRNDLISVDQTWLARDIVEERVTTYELSASGTGLVFIADQLNKPMQQGCYYVTFFDIDTRDVLSSERRCGAAGGIGFRNYWFGTVKDVIAKLPRKVPTRSGTAVQR